MRWLPWRDEVAASMISTGVQVMSCTVPLRGGSGYLLPCWAPSPRASPPVNLKWQAPLPMTRVRPQ